MPKSKKTIPIYEYPEKVNGQTRYYIRPYVNGKQITKRLDDDENMWLGRDGYNKALEEITKLEEKLLHKKTDELLFETVAIDYFNNLSKFNKPSTYNSYFKAYNTHIKDYFKNFKIADIDVQEIKKWHNVMLEKNQLSSSGKEIPNKPLSISYLNKVNAVLCNIFSFGAKEHSLPNNPALVYGCFKEKKGIIKEVKRNYITFAEFKKFISVIKNSKWYTFFNFLWYADPRKGEAMCLHWSMIDFSTRKITLKNTLQVDIKGGVFETTNKTDTKRIVIMNRELYNILYNYKQEQMKLNGFNEDWYVFGGIKPLSKTTIDRYKDKYFEESGVYRITNHQFRHSLTTELIKEYIKKQQQNNVKIDKYAFLSALAQRNGHTVETMLKYYAHLFPDTEQQQIIELLDNLS